MSDPEEPHALDLRRRSLELALDLSGEYSRHDSRAILAMADALLDSFVFPLSGRNEPGMADLERMGAIVMIGERSSSGGVR